MHKFLNIVYEPTYFMNTFRFIYTVKKNLRYLKLLLYLDTFVRLKNLDIFITYFLIFHLNMKQVVIWNIEKKVLLF